MNRQIITRSQKAPVAITWAAFPGPTLAPAGLYYFSDVGVNGSLWYNNGVTLNPVGPVLFLKNDNGYIVPALAAANAATYSQSGTTLTVVSNGHTMSAGINGYNVYLAIGSGAAVTGWFSNFTYVDANTFTCTSTVSQTTSGVVNTNTSKVAVVPLQKTIPASMLGLTGKIRFAWNFSCNNSAGTKTMGISLGGTTVTSNAVTTATFGSQGTTIAAVRNVKSKIIIGGSLDINTAIDAILVPELTVSAASNFIALETFFAELVF